MMCAFASQHLFEKFDYREALSAAVFGSLILAVNAGLDKLFAAFEARSEARRVWENALELLIDSFPEGKGSPEWPTYRVTLFQKKWDWQTLIRRCPTLIRPTLRIDSTHREVVDVSSGPAASQAQFQIGIGCAGGAWAKKKPRCFRIPSVEDMAGASDEERHANWGWVWQKKDARLSPASWSKYMEHVRSMWVIPICLINIDGNVECVGVLSVDSLEKYAFENPQADRDHELDVLTEQTESPLLVPSFYGVGLSATSHRTAIGAAIEAYVTGGLRRHTPRRSPK